MNSTTIWLCAVFAAFALLLVDLRLFAKDRGEANSAVSISSHPQAVVKLTSILTDIFFLCLICTPTRLAIQTFPSGT